MGRIRHGLRVLGLGLMEMGYWKFVALERVCDSGFRDLGFRVIDLGI